MIMVDHSLPRQFAHAHDAIGVIHSVFLYAINRRIHIAATPVEVCGMHVNHQRLPAHLLGVDAGRVSQPVVRMDDVELLLACNNSRHNPSADMTRYGDYPICWPAFAGKSQYQSDHCLWLRQRHCKDPENPTFEEWKSYIAGQKIVAAMYNGTAPEWRRETAKESVEELKDLTYTDADGETRPLFPAAREAALAFDGRGYIPSQLEISEAFGDVNYGIGGVAPEDYDPITRALLAVSGRAIDFQQYTIFGAGNNGAVHERCVPGYMDQAYLFSPMYVAIFARYELSELND